MIITISGTPGSGKSTVGELLSKKLKFEFYDVGKIRRSLAVQNGMTLDEYNKFGETDASTDLEVDDYQRNLAKKEGNLILVSRLGFNFVPKSVKVFLKADLKESARRIMNDPARAKEEKALKVEDVVNQIQARNSSDRKRYNKYYNLNPYDTSQYDLVIDTSKKNPQEIVNEIIAFTKKKR